MRGDAGAVNRKGAPAEKQKIYNQHIGINRKQRPYDLYGEKT